MMGFAIDVPSFGGFRSLEDQQQLEQWRADSVKTGKGDYAVARPGTSKHERGEAFDVRIPGATGDDPRYKVLADYAPEIGLRAGYYFKTSHGNDPFHFELATSARPLVQTLDPLTVLATNGDDSGSASDGSTLTPWVIGLGALVSYLIFRAVK